MLGDRGRGRRRVDVDCDGCCRLGRMRVLLVLLFMRGGILGGGRRARLLLMRWLVELGNRLGDAVGLLADRVITLLHASGGTTKRGAKTESQKTPRVCACGTCSKLREVLNPGSGGKNERTCSPIMELMFATLSSSSGTV